MTGDRPRRAKGGLIKAAHGTLFMIPGTKVYQVPGMYDMVTYTAGICKYGVAWRCTKAAAGDVALYTSIDIAENHSW